ncbi:MAG: presqualene diphosphate synthase HpnD [Dehalococcoidia bacterium]|nr:presqualene diphosphate synthase HpnD [Dehalococcoidia bacterium]
MSELTEAYEECRRITLREAKNFYYAFITLPRRKRYAIYAAYTFCRICDDIADGDQAPDAKLGSLQDVREDLARAYAGQAQSPVYLALADAASAYDIPEQHFRDVVTGVEMDLTKTSYQDFDELYTYCYHVACAVGLVCLQVFGYSNDKAKDYAIDLGLAMQLTNILRDVEEDLVRGRVYIPQDEMDRFGYTLDDLRAGTMNGPFTDLMAFQVERARRHFDEGFRLLPLLSARSRGCPAVLGAIYRRILEKIEARSYNVFQERVSLGRGEKGWVTLRTWVKSLLPTL